MMDRQYGGKIVWECDGCGDTIETGTGDFDEARELLTDEGWVARSEGDVSDNARVWQHYCRKCQ